jgi:head-tail adaptor
MKPIRAGDLRTPVKLGSPTITKDDAGGEAVAWVETDEWAKIEALTGREWLGGMLIKEAVDVRITLRLNPTRIPTARWRVRDPQTGMLYDIQNVLPDAKLGGVECLARSAMGNVDGR